MAAIILDINKAWQSVSMRTILLPAIFAASAIGLACIGRSQPAYAAACPDPSTLTSINDNGDATSFDAITGGSCSGTPDSYGVTIYKMGFCRTDPRPSQGASPDYSSCSLTFENNSGTAANFAAGTSVELDEALAARPINGSYSYLLILLGHTFNIRSQYGPIAGTTYYSTSVSTGDNASADTSGPARSMPMQARSFDSNCVSEDSLLVESGTLTAFLLDSSETMIPASSSEEYCSDVKYILGAVSLNSPIFIDENVISLKANFKVTDNGTTIMKDDNDGLIFGAGPFSVSMSIISR